MNEPEYGTPLEARLAQDAGGKLKRRLRADLQSTHSRIDACLRTPQLPDEYARLYALREACAAALRTLDVVSGRLRRRRELRD